MHFFRLVKNTNASGPTVQECAHYDCTAPTQVMRTAIRDGVEVSTVFIGVAASKYTVFETMVFGGYWSDRQIRCGEWSIACNIHKVWCARVREAEDILDTITKKLLVC